MKYCTNDTKYLECQNLKKNATYTSQQHIEDNNLGWQCDNEGKLELGIGVRGEEDDGEKLCECEIGFLFKNGSLIFVSKLISQKREFIETIKKTQQGVLVKRGVNTNHSLNSHFFVKVWNLEFFLLSKKTPLKLD